MGWGLPDFGIRHEHPPNMASLSPSTFRIPGRCSAGSWPLYCGTNRFLVCPYDIIKECELGYISDLSPLLP